MFFLGWVWGGSVFFWGGFRVVRCFLSVSLGWLGVFLSASLGWVGFFYSGFGVVSVSLW